MDDMEWSEFGGIPSNPSNLLDPPMWSTHTATMSGHCGNWQKTYTKMHRGIGTSSTDMLKEHLGTGVAMYALKCFVNKIKVCLLLSPSNDVR